MTNSRRVVVTGIGLVSSLGIGTDANWAALGAGRSGVGTITKFDASQFATQIAGEVRGFDPLEYIEKKVATSPGGTSSEITTPSRRAGPALLTRMS